MIRPSIFGLRIDKRWAIRWAWGLKFAGIDPAADVIELTQKQARILQDIFERLNKKFPNDPLNERLQEEFEKAIESGRCVIR